MDIKKHGLVVGVDYGTTYSAVAYSQTGDRSGGETEVIQTWPGSSKTEDKVPTEIQYDDNGNPFQWGYQIPAGAFRYGCFKLLLDDRTGETKRDHPQIGYCVDAGNVNATMNLPEGRDVDDITTDYLKQLYEHLMYELEKRFPTTLKITPIHFILTTPAIWSDQAQAATCRAAQQAGFTSRLGDSISMISEPEAAALYVAERMNTRGEFQEICDAGGGTVDLATYSIQQTTPDLRLGEAVVGSGEKCGSVVLDAGFLQFLREYLGESVDAWSAKKKGRGSRLMKEFYEAKKSFDRSSVACDLDWQIPIGNIPDDNSRGIDDGSLTFKATDMASIFDPVVEEIIGLIDKQVTDSNKENPKSKIKTIILVGGFGGSDYLYEKVNKWAKCHSNKMAVANPEKSLTAVVRGAVIHGIRDIIGSRKLKQHYGLQMGSIFDPRIHDELDAFTDAFSGTKWSGDHVEWRSAKGDNSAVGCSISLPCFVSFTKESVDRTTKLRLWGCRFTNPPATFRDDRVHYIGTIHCDFGTVPEAKWRKKPGGIWPWSPITALQGEFTAEMFVGSADLRFKLMLGGICYGSATIEY